MTDHRPNTYDDDDMQSVLDRIEEIDAQKKSIMATAMAECGKLSDKIKEIKKEAADDLKIPRKVLNPLLKRRRLERQIEAIDGDVDEDFQEVYVDACGQFAMFAPVDQDETSNLGAN